ncbi:RelA/SpoT domain-containing protein [Laspinema sp. D5]|nr:RelA/SpoT domain-containing protein [Laspinema sp. D3d]MCT7971240.1 RelA/SpoT domain-containing protein [Laspinema sp. D3d]
MNHKKAIDKLTNQIYPILHESGILACRIKRLPSIIGKLRRYPNIKLSKMQDVVGIRVILPNIQAVYEFDEVLGLSNIVRHRDYIKTPKTTGYRGIHRIYQFNQDSDPIHIELQIRTQQQHLWATAVEMTGLVLGIGDDIKTQASSDDWLEFFALVSSAFARLEGTARVAQHENLSELELNEAIARLDERLGALTQLQAVEPVGTRVVLVDGDWQLLGLDRQRLTVDCLDWEPAVQRYEELERDLLSDQQLVLVKVRLDKLRLAYPNYFLDIQPFVKQLHQRS